MLVDHPAVERQLYKRNAFRVAQIVVDELHILLVKAHYNITRFCH